jgi:signal peptidase II
VGELLAGATHRRLGLGCALLIFVLDQCSKWAMLGPLRLMERGVIELLPIFEFRFVANHGVSMGFLTAGSPLERWLLVGLTAVIAGFVSVWLWRERKRLDVFALGLVLGGAIGNLVDRLFRAPSPGRGHVVDWISVFARDGHIWPIFNLADSAIVTGGALAVLLSLRGIEFCSGRGAGAEPEARMADPAAERGPHDSRGPHV